MPWVRATLRGQLVYARADATGELVVSAGKVEIRYKPNDGRRYDALAKNLEVAPGPVLPEETCAAADKPPPKSESTTAGAAPDGAPSGRTSGAKSPSSGRRPTSSAERKALAAEAHRNTDHGSAILVYTDGACTGNPGPAGLGVVATIGDDRVELSEYLGQATNNIAELTAILRGLELSAGQSERVVLHTDSQYSIGVLTKGWKAKANVELVASIRAALKLRPDVSIRYVPGHSGVPMNERADELARQAIQVRRTQRSSRPTAKKPAVEATLSPSE